MKILDKIKELFAYGKVYICEKCGWQTTKTDTTERLKKHCVDCECQKTK